MDSGNRIQGFIAVKSSNQRHTGEGFTESLLTHEPKSPPAGSFRAEYVFVHKPEPSSQQLLLPGGEDQLL